MIDQLAPQQYSLSPEEEKQARELRIIAGTADFASSFLVPWRLDDAERMAWAIHDEWERGSQILARYDRRVKVTPRVAVVTDAGVPPTAHDPPSAAVNDHPSAALKYPPSAAVNDNPSVTTVHDMSSVPSVVSYETSSAPSTTLNDTLSAHSQ